MAEHQCGFVSGYTFGSTPAAHPPLEAAVSEDDDRQPRVSLLLGNALGHRGEEGAETLERIPAVLLHLENESGDGWHSASSLASADAGPGVHYIGSRTEQLGAGEAEETLKDLRNLLRGLTAPRL
ncbi:hypothetical protein [Streptomyces sp. S1D4-20]|uniref:hypothetical protein n=1 Tax=Streptomyces sp. S1D4-20 TaxID=2594462 RepID=UPI001163D8F1|nr:hypothetical protein [Streptomyces sp. S1D4-20]QDN54255.1 hypothetical protein FNV67_01440 [Streptomyces sp. S1D4-20]